MDKQQEFVLRTLEERDIRFIRLWFTDVLGILKSVAVAPAELEAAFAEGIGFDGSAIEGFARGLRVGHARQARPDDVPGSAVARGAPGAARMFCDILMPDGSPSLRRPALRAEARAGARAAEHGFTFYTHPEIEFFLFEEPPEPGAAAGAGRLRRATSTTPRTASATTSGAQAITHARVDGHLGRVQPPRGRARASRRSTCATPTR